MFASPRVANPRKGGYAMQKQQKAKAGMKPPLPKDKFKLENKRRKPQ